MSEENVELVRRALGAAFRKPNPDYDTINLVFHPDHEIASMLQPLAGGATEGAGGFRDWLINMDEAWERWEIKLEQLRSIDADRVLVDVPFSAVSSGVGVPVEQSTTAIVTVREGKVVRTEIYSSREEALEAAGLSE